jgi:hypothetical protein
LVKGEINSDVVSLETVKKDYKPMLEEHAKTWGDEAVQWAIKFENNNKL